MLSQNKTVNYVVGGLAIASLALLAYTVTRPTRESKTKRKKQKGSKSKKGNKKKDILSRTFTKKPIDIHLVMENLDGFNAHVAGDKKNVKLQLKYGSRLIKINDKRVENQPYEEIYELIQKAKFPITLQFKQFSDLNLQWTKAEKLKEEANNDFKSGNIELAIKKVSQAIELHSTNKIYYSNRILMYFKLKEYDLALKDCQIIRELDPKSVYIKGHYLRGLTLMNLKKYKNAASAFQTVVKLNPSFKKATDRLNECLKELNQEIKQNQKRKSSKQEQLKETFSSIKQQQQQPQQPPQQQPKPQSKQEDNDDDEKVKGEESNQNEEKPQETDIVKEKEMEKEKEEEVAKDVDKDKDANKDEDKDKEQGKEQEVVTEATEIATSVSSN